jgi:hypothetical protein
MNEDVEHKINSVIERAPVWIRQDLLAKEDSVRQRAEEALSAMIAAALNETDPQ